MTSDQTIEIEIDSPQNRGHLFAPAARRLRGRLDFGRDSEPESVRKLRDWQRGVPGQVIGLNLDTGEGFFRDPLHGDAELKQKLERRGERLALEHESQGGVHLPTWLYWMRRAVDGGHARLLHGELPALDEIEGQPRRHFNEPPRSAADQRLDRLIEALQRLSPPQ